MLSTGVQGGALQDCGGGGWWRSKWEQHPERQRQQQGSGGPAAGARLRGRRSQCSPVPAAACNRQVLTLSPIAASLPSAARTPQMLYTVHSDFWGRQ